MSVEIASEAAHAAGRILASIGDGAGPPQLPPWMEGGTGIHRKGTVDLVTRVDLACEDAIRSVLTRRTPEIPILGEEEGGTLAPTCWIVDPLDGTTNFVHGFPAYCVSVGLRVDGQLASACIYDPIRRQTYTAERGRGAFCGEQRLKVSETARLEDALLLTGFAYDRRERAVFYLRFVQCFLERSRGLRRAGSAALDLTHVATGRADGFWEFGLSPWDVAAGILLIEEAGGKVTDMSGSPLSLLRPRLLATNARIHDEMSLLLMDLLSDQPPDQPSDKLPDQLLGHASSVR